MSNARYAYTREKLSVALHSLATGPGNVRERLLTAYMEFHTLTPEDFPEEFKDDWRWITYQITRFGPLEGPNGEIWQGSAEHTLTRIRNKTGVKIADKIYELQWKLNEDQYL